LTASFARRLVAAAVLVTAAGPIPASAGPPPDAWAQRGAAALHLLDVPYLPQSELLCGGAAIAMVMRYWGTANVYAETFADLVDPAAGGIHGSDLLEALRSRGWMAESFRGDSATVQAHLRAGRPVIVLIEDRPGRYHYVVVVGWSSGRVIVHDPARAPFRVLDEKAFELAWTKSDRWSVAPVPGGPPRSASTSEAEAADEAGKSRGRESSSDRPCDGMVDEGVRLAGAGDVSGARRIFEVAAESCPEAPGPWREMAGLHVLRSEWPAAANDARSALERDPADALAARILATALFLDHDADAALEAWNRVGEPLVDLVNVTGLERIRYGVASRALSLPPQSVLTPQALRAARRRLADVPAAQTTRVAFTPQQSGRARIDAVVVERPLLPRSPVAIAALGVHALSDREIQLRVASPTGAGEVWRASWRWWEHRPRVTFGFDAPAPFGGVWGISMAGERQSYTRHGSVVEESRRRLAYTVSRWSSGGLRWEGTAGLDRIREAGVDSRGNALALGGAVHQVLADDRAYVEAGVGYWIGGVRTATVALRSEWRSRTANEGQVWIVRGGADRAASGAPLALWPGAGTGQGRDVLLRAHSLLDDGVIRGGVFGQELIHGGVESRLWRQLRGKPVRLGPALFVDAARAFRGLNGTDGATQVDAGVGLRLAIPGSGVLRIDLAHGLRDGRNALSIGWVR
jgi:hypothetical protein